VTRPIEQLRSDLRALETAYVRGSHGRWSARRRAEAFDRALRDAFAAAGPPAGASLVALGGYGRMRQLPSSDVDLLVLHDGGDPARIEGLVAELLYPLWDEGFAVGQAVRTPSECVEAAERLDALTAMLDGRVLAGDPTAWEETSARIVEPLRADPPAFVDRLAEARARRRDRYGDASHLLEPDLKGSVGGQRDVASLGWVAAALGEDLEALGVLRPREHAAVDEAEEFLIRARSALHLETGKRSDRLVLDLQPDLARAMGFADEPRLRAVDALMRALFEHARQVEHVTSAVFDRVRKGELRRDESGAVGFGGPDDALDAVASAAERSGVLATDLLEALEATPWQEGWRWGPAATGAFLRILRAGAGGRAALEALDRLDLLARYLPAWAGVRCRPQRDPYHRFTVDTHLTETLAGMQATLAGAPTDDPVEEAARSQVEDPDALLLGALLHDIGKRGEGNHVPVGAEVAAQTLRAMALPEATRDLAVFMVTEHLLLPDTATRRDLTDENLILDVAATIGSSERLAALYLLAKADAGATGPAAWTPWRRALVRELVAKVQHVFDRGAMGQELAVRLTERVDRVRELLEGEPDEAVDAFVLRMPRGYFLAVEPAHAARHFRSIAPALGANEVRTAVQPGARPGTYELLVVAADRRGLLSQIAGALALAGLSILTAQVFTTDDGAAADLFEVEGAFEREIGEERWRAFRSTLRRAIEGAISLDRRVAEKRRHYPPARDDLPVTVEIDDTVSDFSTVIEVGAPDRLGLLFDITAALADLHLDVHLAKVATYTDRVIDAFYVRDPLGRKIVDPAQVEEIRAGVLARLADSAE
jgi:[protein-PII] uridylyltransferase